MKQSYLNSMCTTEDIPEAYSGLLSHCIGMRRRDALNEMNGLANGSSAEFIVDNILSLKDVSEHEELIKFIFDPDLEVRGNLISVFVYSKYVGTIDDEIAVKFLYGKDTVLPLDRLDSLSVLLELDRLSTEMVKMCTENSRSLSTDIK